MSIKVEITCDFCGKVVQKAPGTLRTEFIGGTDKLGEPCEYFVEAVVQDDLGISKDICLDCLVIRLAKKLHYHLS